MARKRTKAEDIKNPDHYFNKYIAMEVKHDKMKQAEIEDKEYSLEEKSKTISFEYSIAVNKNGELYEKIVAGDSEFAWIEEIKVEKLYAAIQTLTHEQKETLTAMFVEQMTQDELAHYFQISQQAVSKRIKKIFEKIRKYFQKWL